MAGMCRSFHCDAANLYNAYLHSSFEHLLRCSAIDGRASGPTIHPFTLIRDTEMADYAFAGNDEEYAELKKLNAEVVRVLHLT